MTVLKGDDIYREEIPSRFITVGIWGNILLAGVFLALMMIQIYQSPLGADPVPDIIYLLLVILFLFLAGLFDNVRLLVVSVTPFGISAGYGHFKFTAFWDNIESYLLDEGKLKTTGESEARVRTDWPGSAVSFTAPGRARLVLRLRTGRFKNFVFSTRSPDELLRVISQQLKDRPYGLI